MSVRWAKWEVVKRPNLIRLQSESMNIHLGVSQHWGYHFGGPNKKDCSIWGVYIGVPLLGKLPFLLGGPCCMASGGMQVTCSTIFAHASSSN